MASMQKTLKFSEKDRRDLLTILATMPSIPKDKCNNLPWLGKHLFISNRNHKQYAEAMVLIRKALNTNYLDLNVKIVYELELSHTT